MVFSAPCTEYKSYLQLAIDLHKELAEKRLNVEQSDFSSAPESTTTSVRVLSKADIMDIINGSAAFAGGGGGSKQYGDLLLEQACNEVKSEVNVCSQISIQDLDNGDGVIPFAFMGKPTAIQDTPQMLPVLAKVTMEAYEKFFGKEMKYVCGVEVGPTNSVAPMFVAAYANSKFKKCYVLDGDLQGRAVLSLSMLGPYMMGVPMVQNCFAYVSKDGNPIPDTPVLSKDTYEAGGVTLTVYGSVTPDNVKTAAETESYLGGIIGVANPNSCLAVAFSELKKEVLLSQKSCSGVKVQTFTPNTLTRSREMGVRLRNLRTDEDIRNLLQEHNAIFLATGNITSFTFPSGPGSRSDLGLYILEGQDKLKYAGVFNNETVQFGTVSGSKDINPILNAPSAVTVQSSAYFNCGVFAIHRGECLTNDELTFCNERGWLYQIEVNAFAMPPAPFLASSEGLAMIGPKSWGVPDSIGDYKTNVSDYIPIPSTYKAPRGEGLVMVNAEGDFVPFYPNLYEEPKGVEARDN